MDRTGDDGAAAEQDRTKVRGTPETDLEVEKLIKRVMVVTHEYPSPPQGHQTPSDDFDQSLSPEADDDVCNALHDAGLTSLQAPSKHHRGGQNVEAGAIECCTEDEYAGANVFTAAGRQILSAAPLPTLSEELSAAAASKTEVEETTTAPSLHASCTMQLAQIEAWTDTFGAMSDAERKEALGMLYARYPSWIAAFTASSSSGPSSRWKQIRAYRRGLRGFNFSFISLRGGARKLVFSVSRSKSEDDDVANHELHLKCPCVKCGFLNDASVTLKADGSAPARDRMRCVHCNAPLVVKAARRDPQLSV